MLWNENWQYMVNYFINNVSLDNLWCCCNVDKLREDNNDVTLVVLEYSDKIHQAALCTFLVYKRQCHNMSPRQGQYIP